MFLGIWGVQKNCDYGVRVWHDYIWTLLEVCKHVQLTPKSAPFVWVLINTGQMQYSWCLFSSKISLLILFPHPEYFLGSVPVTVAKLWLSIVLNFLTLFYWKRSRDRTFTFNEFDVYGVQVAELTQHHGRIELDSLAFHTNNTCRFWWINIIP